MDGGGRVHGSHHENSPHQGPSGTSPHGEGRTPSCSTCS
uniref:Uncharacterized protein n=1 Tax=Nonomuraea gerenzanensis TaxID=93944 RepID=A0A1M4EC76_9ACTN|nr:hypothetical protein BN4615_P6063 [Nonomuraea gerenzanensis]